MALCYEDGGMRHVHSSMLFGALVWGTTFQLISIHVNFQVQLMLPHYFDIRNHSLKQTNMTKSETIHIAIDISKLSFTPPPFV